MAQYELDVLDYWMILKKRKYLIVLATLLVVGFTFTFTQFMKPTPLYEASARVKFDRSTTVAQQLLESITFATANDLTTQTEVIKGFPVMERVAQALGIVETDLPPEQRRSAEYLNTIYNLGQQIQTSRESDTNIIRITATAYEPELAERTANAVAQAYRIENIAARNRMVTESRRFVEDQLAALEEKLQAAEEALRIFKEREGQVFLDDEAKAALQSFTQLEGEWNAIARQKDETLRQIEALERPSSSIDSRIGRIFTEDPYALLTKLNGRLLELLQDRSTLLINYTPEHPQVKETDRKITNVKNEMIRELRSKAASLQDRENTLAVQIAHYRDRYLAFPKAAIELNRLEREVKVNADLYSTLKIKHQELLIKSAEQIEEVTLIAPAVKPPKPINAPNVPLNMAVGSIMGLFLGVVLAFTRESLDTSIGTIEGVEDFLKVPVLGVIPTFDEQELQEAAKQALPCDADQELVEGVSKLITLLDPKSLLSESFRSLRTNIQFASMDRRIKSLLFTSAGLGEGKSTTVINLAITLAQEGQRVLLVDADLRRPIVHKRLGLPREPGLVEALQGIVSWQEAVRTATDLMIGSLGVDRVLKSPGLDNLHILSSGSAAHNPSECMSLAKLKPLLAEMQDAYDIVLFDTPPILPVTDAVAMSSRIDGTVLVYQVGRIGRNALKRAKFLLDHAQANIMGVVLTNVKAEISTEATFYRYEYR
ncbi:Polysaccharide biosynthesis tyrosine autokinase [Nitrospira tepida]|uniref:non-specific protein-tyrosine kinase n=1 Tax=Nitrospira tepida TaxID=2973512 RepID=A0AA86T8H6_9BACT|nr:polysaccharide biosynthesis tyrosine autokinase [Nitrospira tepida]CAI4032253.1 Polysaccharide biosynthesis tyrosine autokinase [Nitrospira tepida]